MGAKRRRKRTQTKVSPWWWLLVFVVLAVAWAAIDDFIKLIPEKPIPSSSKSK
ncbi:MAG: hypothetical protein ACOVP2_04295 [Armatimonadaceae bacterium]